MLCYVMLWLWLGYVKLWLDLVILGLVQLYKVLDILPKSYAFHPRFFFTGLSYIMAFNQATDILHQRTGLPPH